MSAALQYAYIIVLAILAAPFLLAALRWFRDRLAAVNAQRATLAARAQTEAMARAARRLQTLADARAAAERATPEKLAQLREKLRGEVRS